MNSGPERGLSARAPGVISHDVGDEIVVVDPASTAAHSLVGDTTDVWCAAGSISSFDGASTGAVAHLLDLGPLIGPGELGRGLLTASAAGGSGGFVATSTAPGGAAIGTNTLVVTDSRNDPASATFNVKS